MNLRHLSFYKLLAAVNVQIKRRPGPQHAQSNSKLQGIVTDRLFEVSR
jgi:hypothetical protein